MTEQAYRREDGLPSIGLAMIVKDEEASLGKLLDSVGWSELDPEATYQRAEDAPKDGVRLIAGGVRRPEAAVDVVVVCDTGSSDGTIELARARGCHVVEFEWTDHFGEARQASYDALPDVDFTLWADGDDVLEGAEQLRLIASRLPAEVAGTIHRYDYAQDPAGNCVCELWRERMVRRGIGERWHLPVHEVLDIPTGQLVHTDEVVWHHHQPEGKVRDPERNYRILKRDLDEAVKRDGLAAPRTLAYLGTEALALGRQEEAIALFTEYLDRPDATNSEERCQVAHKLSIACRQLGDRAAAGDAEKKIAPDLERKAELVEASTQAAFKAIRERPDWPDGHLDLAELALDQGEPERALHFCEVAEKLPAPRTLLITNPLEYAYQPKLMRSVALGQLGLVSEAFEQTQECLAITPYREDLLGQARSLALQVRTQEAVGHLLQLRELLVRHDENAKAAKLMDCAPYFIWNRPEVAQARLDQREMTLHAFEPATYRSYYRTNPGETPFEAQGVPIEDAHKVFHRVKFLRDGLTEQVKLELTEGSGGEEPGDQAVAEYEQQLRILDLSANDGWMLANLAAAGYGTEGALHGMDLNADAAERANQREQFDHLANARVVCADLHTAAEHYEAGSYDAVVCYETIEHVPDVPATFDVMQRMVRPGGRIYVSTPDGAFEGGNLPAWHVVEAKGHLRAMRPHDVCEQLVPRGVIHDMTREQGLIAASLEVKPRKGRVVFYAGAVEALPEKIITEGLGGSETALCKMAEELCRRGWDVRVYAGAGADETGGVRGDRITVGEMPEGSGQVLYAPAGAWDPGERCDLFVSSRLPEAFDRTINAPVRALWLHDADYGDRLTLERVERATHVLFLSDFQAELLAERYPHPEPNHKSIFTGRGFITRNGIEPSFFTESVEHRKPWVVYSSSPDRGLDVLLECWPLIRKRAEEAGVRKPELHHTYAPVYAEFRDAYPHLQAFHARVAELSEAAGAGVVAHDHLNQRELAELYLKSKVWAYPSWNTPSHAAFPEISCISAMEAQAAGAVPVHLDYGALLETVQVGRGVAPMTAGDPPRLSTAWRERFIELVVEALTNRELQREVRERARPWALEQGWSGVAEQWETQLLGVRRELTEAVAA